MDRSKSILVFMDKHSMNTKKYHCCVCKDWNSEEVIIGGTCSIRPYRRVTCASHIYDRDKPPVFNNTEHVPLILKGQPCTGNQFGCYPVSCIDCIIYKVKFVLPPLNGLKQ